MIIAGHCDIGGGVCCADGWRATDILAIGMCPDYIEGFANYGEGFWRSFDRRRLANRWLNRLESYVFFIHFLTPAKVLGDIKGVTPRGELEERLRKRR